MVAILAVLFGCSGDDETGLIDAEDGGTVCAPTNSVIAGTCLTVPAGALSEDTTIEIKAASDIISSPSIALTEAVEILPAGTALSEDATLTLPYDADNIGDFFTLDPDAIIFKQGDPVTFTANGELTIDTAKATLAFGIDSFGTFQGGFRVETALSVGDFVDVPLAASRGSVTLTSSAAEKYLFLVTSFPPGYKSDPDNSVMTTDFSLTSTTASSGLKLSTKLSSGDATGESSLPIPTPQLYVDGLMRQRARDLIEKGLAQGFMDKLLGKTPAPLTKSGSGLNFCVGDGSNIDDKACTVRMLDVCNTSSSSVLTYDALVKAITNNGFRILVDESSVDGTTAGKVDAIKSALEQNIAPRLEFFFGDFSDVDANDMVEIVMTDLTCGVLGFYDATNQSEFDGSNASNEADVLFVTHTSSNLDLLASTAGHELQHNINFNEATLKKIVSGEGEVFNPNSLTSEIKLSQSYTNEGFSYNAEAVCGYQSENDGPEDFASMYLTPAGSYEGQAETSLIDNSNFVSARVRGANFLFLRYLLEQTGGATQASSGSGYTDNGGAAFFKAFISSDFSGITNFDQTLPSFDPFDRDFESAFRDYMVTLYNASLASPILTSSRYLLQTPYSDNFTGDAVGIDLDVDIPNGPAINDFSDGDTQIASSVRSVAIRMLRYGVGSSSGLNRFLLAADADEDGTMANLQMRVLRVE